nr:hypothetical protein [Desulfobulbaceae bacterium]
MCYNGLLQNAPGAGHFPDLIFPKWFEDSVIIFDTSSLSSVAGHGGIGQSKGRANVVNAAIIKRIVDYLISNGPIVGQDIGVITPYTTQEKMLQEMLCSDETSSVTVGTVHKFQGASEKLLFSM